MPTRPFLWLRTIRHFPPAALWHRLRLKIAKRFYKPVKVILLAEQMMAQWQTFYAQTGCFEAEFPPSFVRWQYQTFPAAQGKAQAQAQRMLRQDQAELLNQPFTLLASSTALADELCGQTPLWQENYGYLEFLLPLIWLLQSEPENPTDLEQARMLLESQLTLFFGLSFQLRCWSTYGVSRRLLTYCELLPVLAQLSGPTQRLFWVNFYQESHFLAAFLEWDVSGNHLIQNLTSWLAVSVVLRQIPATHAIADEWQKALKALLLEVFAQQILADGLHYERTPMYHLWVWRDLLDILARLKHLNPWENERLELAQIAGRMQQAAMQILHADGQVPLMGDASLPQMPDFQALSAYAHSVAGVAVPPRVNLPFQLFPQAGFAVFRNAGSGASLILDCGDFGPKDLPAHAHCDLGSFELRSESGPLIVDAGISEYAPSLLRDYFRGTAAHNTIWFPGQEQAEIWGSFRVAEYPRLLACHFENKKPMSGQNGNSFCPEPHENSSDVELTVAYENYNAGYVHQRRVRHVAQRFWVIEDRVETVHSPPQTGWSLLHLHPDCAVETERDGFMVARQLLVIPFGAGLVEWSKQAPWRGNLNLYSEGFNLARPGQIIAQMPNFERVSGWLLVPFATGFQPGWHWQDDLLTLAFPDDGARFYFRVQPEGLRPCAPPPGL